MDNIINNINLFIDMNSFLLIPMLIGAVLYNLHFMLGLIVRSVQFTYTTIIKLIQMVKNDINNPHF